MERAERYGLGASAVGHIVLLAALSLGLFAAKNKLPTESQPLDVMFVDEVAEQAAAPKASSEAPAPSEAPAVGPPEPAPPPPASAAPAPATPTPPKPAPAPTPSLKPAPQKAAPAPKPSPKPLPEKPAAPAAKAAPAKPVPAKAAPAREKLGSDFLKGLKTERPSRTAVAARGSRLGPDFLKGVAGSRPGTANTPPAAMSGAAAASLAAAIREQLARYWVPPSGPIGGLRTSLRVRLNRDGSIAGRPEVIDQDGVNDTNRAYAKQHADAAIRTVFKAAPLKLPPKLYDAWKLLEPLNFDATLDR